MVTLQDTQPTRQTRNGGTNRLLAGILLLLPVVVFWYVWSQYAVNVPKYEDHALKDFLLQLDTETSFSGKIHQFFKQHNEHRIVYDRFITWLDFSLFGKLNYVHLMLIGNVGLLGILVLFGLVISRSLRDKERASSSSWLSDGLLYLPPVAFLLLNLSHWENMFWGMAAVQNFTVMLWIFWTLYALTYVRSIVLALVLATMATLTSGNGLLIWPVGFAIVLAQYVLDQSKNRRALLSWILGAIFVIGLYFLDYAKPPGNPAAKGSVLDLLKGWLAFTGAAAEAFPVGTTFTNSLLLGTVLTVSTLIFGITILQRGLKQQPLSSFDYFFASSALFILGTAAIVAWSRVGFGVETLITSRYKIYSLLLLMLVYSYAVIQVQTTGRKWILGFGLLFSISLMASSYRTYLDETTWWRQYLLTSQFNWTYSQNGPVSAIDPITARWIDSAPAFYDNVLSDLYNPAAGPSQPLSSIQKSGKTFVFTDTLAGKAVGPDAGTYLLFRSPKRLYLFQTTPVLNTAWKARVGLTDLYRKGFSSSLFEGEMEPGTYQIERLTVDADKTIRRYPTQQLITTTPQVRQEIQKNW